MYILSQPSLSLSLSTLTLTNNTLLHLWFTLENDHGAQTTTKFIFDEITPSSRDRGDFSTDRAS